MNVHFPQLDGEHVILKPLQRSHAQDWYEAGKYPEIWRYMFMKIGSPEDAEQIIEDALENMRQGTEFTYTIVSKKDNRVIGSTRMFDYSASHKQLEIGHTWLTPDVWGTPVNSACKYLLLNLCFENLGLLRVQVKTDLRNQRAQKAIEKMGAAKEGTLRKHRVLPDGYVRDTVMYSIIDEDWESVKAILADVSQNTTGNIIRKGGF